MPRQRRAAAGGQQPQAIIEARGQIPDPERVCASRSELNSERNPVQLCADVGNGRGVSIVEFKLAQARGRAFDEQLNGRVG